MGNMDVSWLALSHRSKKVGGATGIVFFVFLSIFWFEHDHFRPFRNYWCEISRVTFPVIVMINVNKYTKLYLSEVCQMGLSAGCWQCKNVLCQHQWKSLTQPTTLNNHISIKYNSVFCLKKKKWTRLGKKKPNLEGGWIKPLFFFAVCGARR